MTPQKLSSHEVHASSGLGEALPKEHCYTALSSAGNTDKSSAKTGRRVQKCAHLVLDAAQAHWHLDLIGRDERDVHMRAIPHKGKPGRAFNGNFAMDLEDFQAHNNNGYGLYLQPNIGGTLKNEVTLCTSLFNEYDDRPRSEQVGLWESTVGLKPTFQLDTGGKSIHSYWVLGIPMDPKQWTLLMERLQLAAPGCDKNCKGTNRMMRMAGAHYIDREGNSLGQSQIINADGPRYSAEELHAVLPQLRKPKPQPAIKKRFPSGRQNTLPLREIVNALEAIPRRIEGSGTYSDYRDILWGLMAACRDIGVDEGVAISLMEIHSPSHLCGWDVEQVARSGGEQIGAGTLFFHAKKQGWSHYAR